ncbi:hypothetical protein [Actinokineospora spheciospongiae]|uniref:hypothetical protein n=1 Tax=Actinokineospora spheciospongiae TaxID=909613 RepID=UPI00190F2B72|nr:hypothetical protein [Actinokineospora spheciospongiae]
MIPAEGDDTEHPVAGQPAAGVRDDDLDPGVGAVLAEEVAGDAGGGQAPRPA